MFIDTCMAVWNMLHRGKWGRALDTALSLVLIGMCLFLFMNIAFPALLNWSKGQSAEERVHPTVVATGVTPTIHIAQASPTVGITPTATRAVAQTYPCAPSAREREASADQETNQQTTEETDSSGPIVKRQPTPADTSDGHAVSEGSPTSPDEDEELTPTPIDPLNRPGTQQQTAEPVSTKEAEHGNWPDLGALPGLTGRDGNINGVPPVTIPTPFPHSWHDQEEGDSQTGAMPETSEPARTPAAVPSPRKPVADASQTTACFGNTLNAVSQGETLARLYPFFPWAIATTILFYGVVYWLARRRYR